MLRGLLSLELANSGSRHGSRSSLGVRTLVMPITKQQDQVPGVSEEEALKEQEAAQDEKRAKEQEAIEQGNIPQVSSDVLHNYPDAKYPKAEPEPEKEGTKQPLTGAAATAEEHPSV